MHVCLDEDIAFVVKYVGQWAGTSPAGDAVEHDAFLVGQWPVVKDGENNRRHNCQ